MGTAYSPAPGHDLPNGPAPDDVSLSRYKEWDELLLTDRDDAEKWQLAAAKRRLAELAPKVKAPKVTRRGKRSLADRPSLAGAGHQADSKVHFVKYLERRADPFSSRLNRERRQALSTSKPGVAASA